MIFKNNHVANNRNNISNNNTKFKMKDEDFKVLDIITAPYANLDGVQMINEDGSVQYGKFLILYICADGKTALVAKITSNKDVKTPYGVVLHQNKVRKLEVDSICYMDTTHPIWLSKCRYVTHINDKGIYKQILYQLRRFQFDEFHQIENLRFSQNFRERDTYVSPNFRKYDR